MNTYTWKIEHIELIGGLIHRVKYNLTVKDGDFIVETEGFCEFPVDDKYKYIAELKEKNITDWVDEITQGAIKSNLDSQIEALKLPKSEAELPWLANTFIPGM